MKTVVTGGKGFIGNVLVKKLKSLNFEVKILDISNGTNLTDWNQISSITSFDVLIHLAAKSYVPESYKYPQIFYETNIVSTLNCLELCRKNKAKFIYTSSYVYGNPQYLPIDEIHPVKSFNPYSNTKVIGEQICRGYHADFGVPIIIFRPFNIYGPAQNKRFLISNIISQISNKAIYLQDPNPKRDYLFVDDMINAYIKILNYKPDSFEIFNLGYGKSYSVPQIIKYVEKIIDKKLNVKYSNVKRKNEINDVVANIEKIQKYLNWSPQISLMDGLQKMLL